MFLCLLNWHVLTHHRWTGLLQNQPTKLWVVLLIYPERLFCDIASLLPHIYMCVYVNCLHTYNKFKEHRKQWMHRNAAHCLLSVVFLSNAETHLSPTALYHYFIIWRKTNSDLLYAARPGAVSLLSWRSLDVNLGGLCAYLEISFVED